MVRCVFAVTETIAQDIGNEKDRLHLSIREQVENVKEEHATYIAGVAGKLTDFVNVAVRI